jgi:hypothetical protein
MNNYKLKFKQIAAILTAVTLFAFTTNVYHAMETPGVGSGENQRPQGAGENQRPQGAGANQGPQAAGGNNQVPQPAAPVTNWKQIFSMIYLITKYIVIALLLISVAYIPNAYYMFNRSGNRQLFGRTVNTPLAYRILVYISSRGALFKTIIALTSLLMLGLGDFVNMRYITYFRA